MPDSLKDRISNAKSAEEVEKLLAEGATYTWATAATKAKWKKAAENRGKKPKERK